MTPIAIFHGQSIALATPIPAYPPNPEGSEAHREVADFRHYGALANRERLHIVVRLSAREVASRHIGLLQIGVDSIFRHCSLLPPE
jgi:hypothetical protein